MIQKWLPQSDLLAHPNIKIFITQCGQQSTEEAIDRTVPMILIPFFADQPGLAAKLQHKGVGRIIDLDNLSEKVLKDTIEEVLESEIYSFLSAKGYQLRHLAFLNAYFVDISLLNAHA